MTREILAVSPTYRLRSDTSAGAENLHQHLAQYQIPSTVRIYGVRSDGTLVPWQFKSSNGAPRLTAGGIVVWLTDCLANAILKLLAFFVHLMNLPAAPYVGVQVGVRLLVSPMRASWAELVLCKWAMREGWEIAPAGDRAWIDNSNLAMARNNPAPPIAFTTAQGWAGGRRSL